MTRGKLVLILQVLRLCASCVAFIGCLLLQSCETAIEVPPDAAKGRIEQAREMLARGRSAAVVAMLSASRSEPMTDAEAVESSVLLGEAFLLEKKHRLALEEFSRADGKNKDQDQRMSYRIGFGSARAAEARSEWGTVEFWIEKAVRSAQSSNERDAALIIAARAAAERDLMGLARERLAAVSDTTAFGYAELVARTGSPHSSGRSTRRAVAPGAPSIHQRSEWGAKPIRTSANPTPMAQPYRITLHHSADRTETPKERDAIVRRMQNYQKAHQLEEGWADIGYHFVIDALGEIWEGRELNWQGAHAGNDAANTGNIGICLMGNFDRTEPAAEQKAALKILVIWLMDKYRIAPSQFFGHDDVSSQYGAGSTACPGRNLDRYLEALRIDLSRN